MNNSRITDDLLALALMDRAAIADSARQMARLSLFDWLMVGRAGAFQPVSQIMRDVMVEEGGTATASLFGSSVKLPPRAAALVNGTISHALDYDDTHFAHVGHMSVAILPAALASGEYADATAAAVCDAFLLGAEAAIHLGLALGRDHYERGFHQTATSGAFGATIAAGRILGLTPEQMRVALSLASTRASGLKSQFGTMGKPYNAGIAAANGVEAALLARKGFTAAHDGIGGPQGFLATHGKAADGPEKTRAGFLFEDIKYKFHACCHGTHAMIEALTALRKEHAFTPESVRRVTIAVNPRWLSVCDIKQPASGLEVKFSYVWLVAMVLQGISTASDATYTDDLTRDARLAELAALVDVAGDHALPDTAARVAVLTGNGQVLSAAHDLSAARAPEAIAQRLHAKAIGLLGPTTARQLIAAVDGIDQISARELALALPA